MQLAGFTSTWCCMRGLYTSGLPTQSMLPHTPRAQIAHHSQALAQAAAGGHAAQTGVRPLAQCLELHLLHSSEGVPGRERQPADVLHEKHYQGPPPLQALLEGKARCVEFAGAQVGRQCLCVCVWGGAEIFYSCWRDRHVMSMLVFWGGVPPLCTSHFCRVARSHPACHLPPCPPHQVLVDAPRPGRVYLPGSFNPLHEGHLRLLQAAVAASSGKEGCFELSVGNADKVS